MKNKPIGPLQKQVLRFILRNKDLRPDDPSYRFSFHKTERARMESLEKRGLVILEGHAHHECHVMAEQIDKIKLALYRA